MNVDATTTIRVLTACSLAGLLLGVGLRLRLTDVSDALRRSRMGWMMVANFVAVPALVLGLARALHLPRDVTIGMILLGAAPFAPVVPVFTRMAKGDLALAAGLTALFPFLAAPLTPFVCELCLKAVPEAKTLVFKPLTVLLVLASTITLPLGIGVAVNHWFPVLARQVRRPIEVLSEAGGLVSLVFVTVVEFESAIAIGWKGLVAMAVAGELSLWLGYALGGPGVGARMVTALGSSNRNIALAVLVALDSFPDTPVTGAVVANGLWLIILGLVHVGFWRFCRSRVVGDSELQGFSGGGR